MGLYHRRVDNEWDLLMHLQRSNPSVLQHLTRHSSPDADTFKLALLETGGITIQNGRLLLTYSHTSEIRFPRFFPSVPIEVRLGTPVFHPNVDPVSGFACLWDRFDPGDTVTDAVCRLQQIISWKLLNLDPDQVIEPRAVLWFKDPSRTERLPFDFIPVVKPEDVRSKDTPALRATARRRRLSC